MPGTVELVIDAKAPLGEGAIWDSGRKVLYWVDIDGFKVHVYDPVTNKDREYGVGKSVGTVVPRKSGGLMLAVKDGFAEMDLETGSVRVVTRPDDHPDSARFNDGKCDPSGRFWAGTMGLGAGKGVLYRLDADLSIHRMLDNLTTPNGIVWSHDKKTMYYIDTRAGEVWAFDYDDATGAITNKRPVVKIPKGVGGPDGMTIDSEGMLWVAHWGGWGVYRWDPNTGKLLDTIRVPAEQVSSCAFGGRDLDVLYITTARTGITGARLDSQPLAGGLFCAKPGARGVPAFSFAG
jgi:sugar lactone lactonase YvrE